MKISVVLPTYNEKESIVDLIDTLDKILTSEMVDFEIVVVDDNSLDGTGLFVKQRYGGLKHITCIIRKHERGLATAIKAGILNSSGEVILLMDTDFNHDPFRIPEMVKVIPKCDIVSGSRYLPGGGMMGSQGRYWGSYVFNSFIRLMLGLKTRDNLSGFVLFRKSILSAFNLDKIFFGYGDYYIRFLYCASKCNLNIIEIPVVYKLRCGGNSKTNFLTHTFEYIKTVIEIKLNKRKRQSI